ncbi:MAG: hypothetical protein K8T90_12855 [Planctomycetes bacterium]|nr:hypothetical protein [Planctomycetota bacterium]
MSDLVRAYMNLEARLLARRLSEALAGHAPDPNDAVEAQIESEFQEIWLQMTPDERHLLRQTREARGGGPWNCSGAGRPDADSPAPRATGLPPRRHADPFAHAETYACT